MRLNPPFLPGATPGRGYVIDLTEALLGESRTDSESCGLSTMQSPEYAFSGLTWRPARGISALMGGGLILLGFTRFYESEGMR